MCLIPGPWQHSERWSTSALSILAVFHLPLQVLGTDSDPTMFQEDRAFSHMKARYSVGATVCWLLIAGAEEGGHKVVASSQEK